MNDLKENLKYLKDISILYVEDNDDIRNEITYTLQSKVKELYVACDGKEGLSLFRNSTPDLIITDISMPHMDGIEMSQCIREENRSVPIVIISAYNDSSYHLDAKKAAVSEFLSKPLDLIKLYITIGKLAKNIILKG